MRAVRPVQQRVQTRAQPRRVDEDTVFRASKKDYVKAVAQEILLLVAPDKSDIADPNSMNEAGRRGKTEDRSKPDQNQCGTDIWPRTDGATWLHPGFHLYSRDIWIHTGTYIISCWPADVDFTLTGRSAGQLTAGWRCTGLQARMARPPKRRAPLFASHAMSSSETSAVLPALGLGVRVCSTCI
jgi:hypothetical protein